MNPNFHGDTLLHRDRSFELIDQPLELYFQLIGTRPAFDDLPERARGYAARWVIEDGWLFLEGMAANWSADKPLRMNDLFPFAGARVFAAWYTGSLRGFRRDRALPDLARDGQLPYPDLTLQIEHGRIATNLLIDRRSPVASERPASTPDRAGSNVIDMAEYRRAGINAAWSDAMV